MSGKLVIIILIALLAGGYCFAQMAQTPADSRPSSLNFTGQQYPRVDSQISAIFRIYAPEVRKIIVSLGNARSHWYFSEVANAWRCDMHEFAPLLFKD
jgi:hypothetical protein